MTAAADDTVLEAVLRRDRQVVVAALIAVIAMAWLWILLGAGTGMSAMGMILGPSPDGMASMMAPALWTLGYAGIMFTMWWVMMAAMMLPSAAPILLLFARDQSQGKIGRSPLYPDRYFRGRLPGRLGSVQRARDRPAMGIGAARPAVADDGDDQLLARRRNPARRRCVAADPHQRHLPAALPLTNGLSRAELAARPRRRVPDGAGARKFLPRAVAGF